MSEGLGEHYKVEFVPLDMLEVHLNKMAEEGWALDHMEQYLYPHGRGTEMLVIHVQYDDVEEEQ